MDVNSYLADRNNLNGHDDVCIRGICIEKNAWVNGNEVKDYITEYRHDNQSNTTFFLHSAL